MTVLIQKPREIYRPTSFGSYLDRDLRQENESVKQEQRERVLRHFVENKSDKQTATIFTLPGVRWAFENYVVDSRLCPNAKFVAAERDWTILQHGAMFMPGTNLHRIEEHIRSGIIYGYETTTSKVLWLQGSRLVEIDRSEVGFGCLAGRWRTNYCNWTAAWWDFMSPLCEDTLQCIRMTERRVDKGIARCPVSITLSMGRELRPITRAMTALVPERMQCKRAKFIERWFNLDPKRRFDFRICSQFKYASVAGAPMMLINAVLDRREA